ncbi:Phosphoglycolate phosphatase [uncultured archaeon]|nr:Phosphoglycolate phosphatase [uncultured archaeon]
MKAIIFDMDGVLVDSMPYHAAAWIKAFADVGIRIERNDIYELEGSNHRQTVDIMFRRFGRVPTDKDVNEISSKKIWIFNRIQHVIPFDGMKELLAELAPVYRLAVVSGSNHNTVHELMDSFFSSVFEVIIDGDDVKKSKPDPEPYLMAVEKLGLPKEECIVIENAPLGIRSAKSAEVRCIAVLAYLGRESLKEADLVVESHRELGKAISAEA